MVKSVLIVKAPIGLSDALGKECCIGLSYALGKDASIVKAPICTIDVHGPVCSLASVTHGYGQLSL